MTDKVAARNPTVRPMIEIELPCCDSPTLVVDLEAPIRCDRCGIDLELADEAPLLVLAAA